MSDYRPNPISNGADDVMDWLWTRILMLVAGVLFAGFFAVFFWLLPVILPVGIIYLFFRWSEKK